MKNIIYIFSILILILSCSKKSDLPQKMPVEKDSIDSIKNVKIIIEELETDCVFDNKPKELTEEWLKEIGFEKFYWDQKNTKAILVQNQDTLLVFKGGCYHLTKSLEIKTENMYEDIFDLKMMQRINELACQFKFENYCGKISSDQFEKIKINANSFLLEFSDDDPEDNLIYSGIEIKTENKKLNIIMSEYYN